MRCKEVFIMIMAVVGVLLAFAAIVLIGAVWTRLSIHRVKARQAYEAGIRSAEKKQFDRVYGKYVHA